MRRHILLNAMLAAALLMPVAAGAQASRNTREAFQDNAQIARGKQHIERDSREIASFERLLADMDTAIRGNSPRRIVVLNNKLRAAMQRELGQAGGDVKQAGRELRHSRREARGERREAGETGRTRDRLQAIDDRHDKRDDRRDRRRAVNRADEMKELIARSEALRAGLEENDRRAVASNRDVLRRFLDVMRADLADARGELGEDRRERREDRRERRSDRRK